jgi:photosystem II stability/assembly factor-like uncharacterized protein
MKKISYTMLLLQGFLNVAGQDFKVSEMRSLEALTIHKLEFRNDIFWGVDYGSGKVIKSVDKGRTWNEIAALKAEYFEKIQFADDNVGFVCGDYGYVYSTSDGGKNWQEISPVIEGRITERYRNDSTKNQKPDGQFIAYYDMFFNDSKNGFVSGFKMNPSIGSYERLTFVTEDGGITWQARGDLRKQDFVKQKSIKGTFIGEIFHMDQKNLWRTKKYENTFIVQKSSDSGESWKNVNLPGYNGKDKWMLRKTLFVDKDIGFVFGGTLNDESSRALVFYTNDGGDSWKQYSNKWPHLHDAIFVEGKIYVSGKNGFLAVIEPIKKLK